MKTTLRCLECRKPVSSGVYEFSQRIYGHSLCVRDQYMIEESGATAHTIDLYLALKEENFPVVLNYFDGHKEVDLAIPGKLHIEITDPYHELRLQAMINLPGSVYSLGKNIPTVIIPNSMLKNRRTFTHAVKELTKACNVVLGQNSLLSSALAIQSVQLQ